MSVKFEEIVWRDELTSNGNLNTLGTVKELFHDCELLPVTKNLDKRATLMFKKDGKVANVVMSKSVNELFRAGKLTIPQVMGFQVIKAENGGFYAALPASGWIEVKTIKVQDFKPSGLSLEDLIKAS
jgi:hypothetical protein